MCLGQEEVIFIEVFVEKGKLLETRGRVASKNSMAEASSSNTYPNNFPIAILVNDGSASASEIFSGVLRDHKRAVLVGEKTFGKGSVLELYPILLPAAKIHKNDLSADEIKKNKEKMKGDYLMVPERKLGLAFVMRPHCPRISREAAKLSNRR